MACGVPRERRHGKRIREARARPRHCAARLLLADQPALLNGILDASGLDRFDLDRDGIECVLDGEEQIARHMNSRDFGFNLEEEDMIAVDNDLAAFIDPAQLYERHRLPHSASRPPLFKPL